MFADSSSTGFDEKHWKEEVDKFNFKQKKLPETKKHNPNSSLSMPSIPDLSGVFFVVIIVIVLVIVSLIVQRMISQGNTNQKIKSTYSASELMEDELKETSIDEWPLQKLLTKYKQENNIRHVIRIYYLMTLQSLHQAQYIQWERNKTNDHYLMELVNRSEYTSFAELSHIFNYVWYGEYSLNNHQYAKACEAFDMFIHPLTKLAAEHE
jgi:uncharacterized protein YxeA